MSPSHRRWRIVALLVALAQPCAAAETPPALSDGPPPRYLELIIGARRGALKEAVAELVGWPMERVELERDVVRERAIASAPTLRAAVLLHTETAFVIQYLRGARAEKPHLQAAEAMMRCAFNDDAPCARDGAPDFEKRWRLAVAHRYHEWVDPRAAYETYQQLLKEHPTDAEVHVALGAFFEHVAASPAAAEVMAWHPRREWWSEAARHYERALAARPDLLEAHLRFGHVAARRKRFDDAGEHLRRVLEGRPAPMLAAFAHLFLGEIDARASRLDAAIEHYRAAIAAEPRLQPAYLSLGQALQRAGRNGEAAAALLEGLRRTPRDAVGWYGYHTSALHGYRESMDALWREVRE